MLPHQAIAKRPVTRVRIQQAYTFTQNARLTYASCANTDVEHAHKTIIYPVNPVPLDIIYGFNLHRTQFVITIVIRAIIRGIRGNIEFLLPIDFVDFVIRIVSFV